MALFGAGAVPRRERAREKKKNKAQSKRTTKTAVCLFACIGWLETLEPTIRQIKNIDTATMVSAGRSRYSQSSLFLQLFQQSSSIPGLGLHSGQLVFVSRVLWCSRR